MLNAIEGFNLHAGRSLLATLRRDPCHNLNAMFALLDRAAESLPRVERENILARPDIGFRDAFLHESLENRGIVAHGLSGNRAGQRFLLYRAALFGCNLIVSHL